MSEQQLLFDAGEGQWKHRLWQRLGAEKRRQVILILAEMVKSSLPENQSKAREESHDERG